MTTIGVGGPASVNLQGGLSPESGMSQLAVQLGRISLHNELLASRVEGLEANNTKCRELLDVSENLKAIMATCEAPSSPAAKLTNVQSTAFRSAMDGLRQETDGPLTVGDLNRAVDTTLTRITTGLAVTQRETALLNRISSSHQSTQDLLTQEVQRRQQQFAIDLQNTSQRSTALFAELDRALAKRPAP